MAHSCSSHRDLAMSKEEWGALKTASPVRVQWDPERDLHHQALPHRAIQIGISGDAVPLYVNQWIQRITDVTDLAHNIHALVVAGKLDEAANMLPEERPYLVSDRAR